MGNKQRRRNSLRKPTHDYRMPGGYAIVLNTEHRVEYFGEIINRRMHASVIGQIVIDEWERIAQLHPDVILDVYQLMPDHFHAIIILTQPPDPTRNKPTFQGNQYVYAAKHLLPHSVSTIISAFKARVTKAVHAIYPHIIDVWQANYYDTCIRSEQHLRNTRAYILRNPQMWRAK